MPATYDLIGSFRLNEATSSVTFSSIPQTYTDLYLTVDGLCTGSNTDTSVLLAFNGDTATNYSHAYIYGNGTSIFGGRAANVQFVYGARLGFNVQSGGFFHIQNYSNTNMFKTVLSSGSSYASGAGVGGNIIIHNTWRSTAAINSIFCGVDSGLGFAAGFTLNLYGIKSA
jgi:hypothetical protein